MTVILVSCCLATALGAQPGDAPAPAARAASPLAALEFLSGDWEASGAGEPGRSVGRFSFQWAADHHALIRANEASTPSGRHSDVMLVFGQTGAIRAVYVDGEGHTIEYVVTVTADPQRAVFESSGPGPRFRLWYQLGRDGAMATGFQIAQAGSSDFKTYLEGVARRK